jgi:hypothetical protein
MNRNPKNPQEPLFNLPGNAAGQHQSPLKLLEEAHDLGALEDQNVVALFESIRGCPNDTDLLKLIDDSLHEYRIREALDPDPFRPSPGAETELNVGDAALGVVYDTGLLWKLPLDQVCHTAILGRTRKGKTSFLYVLMGGMNGKLPYILITGKRDAARLLADPPIVNLVVHFEELKLNLFTPPSGVSESTWCRTVIELLCRTYELQFSRALINECCDELRAEYTAYSGMGNKKTYFTPRALQALLKRKKSKYADGAVAVLDMICRGTLGVFEHAEGFPLERIALNGAVVLVIDALTDDRIARFFVEWITEWLHLYLVHNGPNNGTPQLAFAIDDAHRFFTASHERNALMPISQRYLVAGQAGLCMMAVSQSPADLAPAVLSQSSLIVQIGPFFQEMDVRAMAAALGVPAGGWERLKKVAKAHFVAMEDHGRYDRPFAGEVSRFPDPAMPFTEADRKALMDPVLNGFPTRPAVSLKDVEQALAPNTGSTSPAKSTTSLSQEALALSHDILAYPFDVLSERYTRFSLAGRAAQKVKDELLHRKWVKQHRLTLAHGGQSILLEPLSALASALGRTLPSYGKGGFLHYFMQERVTARLKSLGYQNVRKEKFFGPKAVDVVGLASCGDLEGFEVTVHLSNVVDNFEKDFQHQPAFARVTAICLSANDVRQAKRMLDKAPGLQAFRTRICVEAISAWS